MIVCPKCKGKGWITPENTRGRLSCYSCNKTGKLKDGDIWLCLMPDGETRMPLSLRWEYDDYFVWREYDAYYEIDTVTPLTCLAEIE